MWIAKGTLLALWLFGFGTMAWLYFAVYRRMPPNSAVSVHVITSYTTLNPLWWTALVVCLVLGFAIRKIQNNLCARFRICGPHHSESGRMLLIKLRNVCREHSKVASVVKM